MEHHGAVLAAMALGLGSLLRRCYIPSSWSVERLWPWGSHPDVDPLWSSEAVEIVHDGVEVRRPNKILGICGSDVALDTLRVCAGRRPYPENCRECDKCQATGLALLQAGALDRCRTLGPVTPETIRRTVIRPDHEFSYRRALETIDDPAFKRAIRAALRRAKLHRFTRPAGDLLRRFGLRT